MFPRTETYERGYHRLVAGTKKTDQARGSLLSRRGYLATARLVASKNTRELLTDARHNRAEEGLLMLGSCVHAP
jgi:hypothetical protein